MSEKENVQKEVVQEEPKRNFIESFVHGARRGLTLAFQNMMPNVIFAFALIAILNLSGLMDVIGDVFAPIMGIFGLPGEAAPVIFAAFLSTGGGIGAAVSVAATGALNASHLMILLVGIMLMGSLIQYSGRLLGTAGVPSKYIGLMIGVNVVTGLLAMFVTQFFV